MTRGLDGYPENPFPSETFERQSEEAIIPKTLAGVRIADFSHVTAGLPATQFLNRLGAEVIKVEPPAGDPMRFHAGYPRGKAEPLVGANAGK